MEKYYRFAGLELSVSTREEWMYDDDRMLAPFRVEAVAEPHCFVFTIVDALTPPAGKQVAVMDNLVSYWDTETRIRYTGAAKGDWKTAYLRAEHRGKEHKVEVKRGTYLKSITPKMVLNALEAEHLIAEKDGFVFHSSFIEVEKKGILFTAPSGTGKSTQADLWQSHRNARIINGDRSAVCCREEGIHVCGIPFMGSSQYGENETLPLRGIVYLAQAPETSIRRLRGTEAFCRVWEGVSVNTWDKEDLSKMMDTVTRVISSIPVWYLACTPDESAVIALEEELRKQVNP